MRVVTLTTDYGVTDYYAGALKGVITRLAPQTQVIDITHEIEPFDILSGAYVLRQLWTCFAEGTVHLVVVDPGVGSTRRVIAGQYAGRMFVAPDNGLITLVHRAFGVEALHVVESDRYAPPAPSPTFHGRDIMAPAAAELSAGLAIQEIGRVIDQPKLLTVAHEARVGTDRIEGAALYVDRFGTVVSNISDGQVAAFIAPSRSAEVWVNGATLGPLRSAFHEVAVGTPLGVIGGSGAVEIAVNQGRAVDRFGPMDGMRIEIRSM